MSFVLALLSFLGSEACGTCHPAQLAAWKNTPHARAADRLGARPRARCLACHGTGDAPAGATFALEVGCEACHGAGADYATDDIMRDPALARALGMRDTVTCVSCHRGTGTRLAPLSLAVTPETVH
jgi:nitrate/TMAO reductase-like tetraheme cytochrome c subunit